MNIVEKVYQKWTHVDPRVRHIVENIVTKIPIGKTVRNIPFLQRMVEDEYAKLLEHMNSDVPHLDDIPTFSELPNEGLDQLLILTNLERLAQKEHKRWSDGFASGAVYHGDQNHIQFLNKVYGLFSQSNPLHTDLWPSIAQFEAEIVAMTAKMLGAEWTDDTICGTVSSGGTESILLAMKTYRDWAREEKGIENPEAIVPISAHVAFDKACQYFGIKMVKIPLDAEYQTSVAAVRKAINKNTAVIVSSAPSFPHGIMDPIPELASLAVEKKVNLHVDACLGGFLLPWIRDEYPFAPFDFALKGVTSISVDTHKYGYANKGSSVVLYRGKNLRHYQYYISTDWPGGLYASPTLAGSRPGAMIAQTWATMVSIGQKGYKKNALKIADAARTIREGIGHIPHLKVLGNPIFVIAFASDSLDIFSIMSSMTEKGWSLNGLHRPDCVHLCATLRHTLPGVVDRFLEDLKTSVQEVERNPSKRKGMAPLYGMASSIPARGVVGDFLKRYLDSLYR